MTKELTLNKIAAGLVGVAMMAGLAFAAAAERAHAISLGELVELFIALEIIPEDKADEARAAIPEEDEEEMTSMSCNFTRDLSSGDTGSDVMDLQKLLNGNGFTVSVSGAGSAGMETEYYGPATAAAVAAMQEAFAADILTPLGLTAGTGYFGASTRAKANTLCDDEPDMPDMPDMDDEDEDEMDEDDSELGGDEGSIESVDSASADESNLEEGQEGGVLAFELEIEGDVEINRIDVYTAENGSASDDADDYFDMAMLILDGEVIDEIEVDDFRQDDYDFLGLASDDYRLRFSGLDLVFEDGDEPEFQIGFAVLSNLDSADLATDWDVALESIRYEDGTGFTDTWTDTSSPLNDANETFGFDAEEVAELDITEASSNPDASVVKVDDDTDETDGVTVFVFDIEEENGVDVTIEDLRVTVTATNTVTNEDTVVAGATLVCEGDELDSESVPDGGVVDFENIGLDIEGDGEVTCEVQLDLEGTDGGSAYTNGELVSVAFTSIRDAEDANGNDEGDMTISGTPSGEQHQLQSEGVFAEIVSTDADLRTINNGTEDVVDFEIKFDLTAFDDTFYVGSTSATAVVFSVEKDNVALTGSALTGTTTGATLTSTADEESNGNFRLDNGDTETFTFQVTVNPDDTGSYRVVLNSVEYSAANTGTVDDLSHTASPVQDFRTGSKTITQ